MAEDNRQSGSQYGVQEAQHEMFCCYWINHRGSGCTNLEVFESDK